MFVFFACLVLQKSGCAVMRNDQEDELLAVVTVSNIFFSFSVGQFFFGNGMGF